MIYETLRLAPVAIAPLRSQIVTATILRTARLLLLRLEDSALLRLSCVRSVWSVVEGKEGRPGLEDHLVAEEDQVAEMMMVSALMVGLWKWTTSLFTYPQQTKS